MDLQIRPLTIEELPLCEPYGQAFHVEKEIPGIFSIQMFCRNWTTYIQQFNGIILGLWDGDKLVGGLGGMVAPDIAAVNPETGAPILVATEFFLYIDPEHRKGDWWIQLIEQFREFGKSKGATELGLSITLLKDEDPLVKILSWKYRKKGLKAKEIGFRGKI